MSPAQLGLTTDALVTPRASTPRIAHVAEAFGGGLLEVVAVMAQSAADEGCDVLLVHGRRPETPADPAAIFTGGVTVRELPWGSRTLLEQVRAGRALRRLLEEWQPDVVHLHSSFAGLVGALAVGGRWPVVYTPHAFASRLPGQSRARRAVIRFAERLAVARCAVVGAVSSSEAEMASELGAHAVRIVRNGIPELNYQPVETGKTLTMPALRPRVIAGGRIIGQRQPEACARILGALAERADVAWVGGGGDEGRWGAHAREALDEAGVPVTGWLPREQAVHEMERATVYLHWTAWDGQALSLLEAMAVDTIVIASDIAPNREVLGPHQVCGSEEEAIALIERVVADPALARSMLAEQAERRERFGCRRMCDEWLGIYDELIGAPAPEPAAAPAPAILSPQPAAEALREPVAAAATA